MEKPRFRGTKGCELEKGIKSKYLSAENILILKSSNSHSGMHIAKK